MHIELAAFQLIQQENPTAAPVQMVICVFYPVWGMTRPEIGKTM